MFNSIYLAATSGADAGGMSTAQATKAVFGLLIVFALAYLSEHPWVKAIERRFGLTQVIAFGLPFLFLGLFFRSQDLLSDSVLAAINPLFVLGLGWIGFALGFRFELRLFERFPREILDAFILTGILPFVVIIAACASLLVLIEGVQADAAFVRDALLLATAGAVTTRTILVYMSDETPSATDGEVPLSPRQRLLRLIQLEELAAFAGLILLTAFFRPDGQASGWELPAFGWIFVTVGVSAALGGLIFMALGTVKGSGETNAVMLGAIALASGAAAFLKLSPLVVCFIAGLLLANLPGAWKGEVRQALLRLERPLYLLFLVVAGARWRIDEWEGWVLMGLFVVARGVARFIGVRILDKRHPQAFSEEEDRHIAGSPMGGITIAIVVGALELFNSPSTTWIVQAVVFGALISEFLPSLLRNVLAVAKRGGAQ